MKKFFTKQFKIVFTIFCLAAVFVFSVISVKAQTNYALNFNGSNQNIVSSSVGSTITDKTYSAWVKLNNTSQGGGGLVSLETSDGNTFDAIVYNETGNGWGFGSNGFARTVWSGVTENSTSTWVHIAATYSNNSYKLYRNGILILSTTSFGITSMPSSSRILVGRRHSTGGSNSYLNASIDEVSVWNRALSQSEIQDMSTYYTSPSANGLIAYYKLDEGSGSSASSSSTYLSGVNGSLVNSPTWVSSGISLNNACPSITAAMYGTTSLCIGYTTILNTYITGGTSPYTLVYSDGTINNYTSGANIYVSPSSTTTYTLTSVTDANGCAATVSGSPTVTIKNTSTSSTTISACDSLWWNGVKRTSSGTYTWNGSNAVGCDSTATLHLTIKNSTSSTTNSTICNNQLPYSWNGLTIPTAGSQTAHLTNAAGCDSAATINLTVNFTSSSTTNITICSNSLPYTWNGLTFDSASSQTAHLTNAAGCDSAATLNLTVNEQPNAGADITACAGSSIISTLYIGAYAYAYELATNPSGVSNFYAIGGSGNYHIDFASNANGVYGFVQMLKGCTDTMYVTVNSNSTSNTTTTVCDSLVWNGTTYTSSGTYTWTGTNAVGCDSTATLNLTIKTNYNIVASAGSNGSISPSGTSVVCNGTNQSYTITPSSGYHILNVLVDGSSVGTSNTYTFNNVAAAHTISVTFENDCTPTITCSSNITVNNTAGLCGATVTVPAPTTYFPCGGSSLSAPFSSSNSNLKLWIDATKFSTTNGSSLSGVITDASSYARSLTTNATYETTGFNGMPSVRYNNNQTATTSAFNTDQDTYVYTTVELVAAGSSWASVFYHWNRDAGLTIEQNGTTSSNVYHWQTGNDNSGCDQTISFGTKYIMAATITGGNVRNFTLYKNDNGTLQNLGTVSNSNYTVPVASGNLFLGKSDGNEYTNMRMGEFIYFQGSLPVSESSIINYLYSKWLLPNTVTNSFNNSSDASGFYPVGTTNITWTASDPNGNSKTCTQSVTVVDNQAPTTPTLSTINAICSVTVTAPTTTDNCSGTVTGTTTDSLTYTTNGTRTIHWTFTDAANNSTTANQTVIVAPPAVDSIVGLTNIEILAIGGGGGAGGPDGPVGAGGGAGGAVYGKYILPANGSNLYTVAVGGGGGYGQGCAGSAPGGTAGANGGGTGGAAGPGGCSGGGGGGGGWSGFYQGSTYYVVAGGGAGGGGSNEGTANDITTPGGGNQSIANGTNMTGQNGTAYSGDGGGGGAGGGGFYGGAGQSSLNQTNLTTSQAWGGANYANSTNQVTASAYMGNSGATSSTGIGGQGTTTTISNSSNFNYTNTYGKGGNAQGNGGTSTTANGNNGVVIIRYQGSPVATGGTITQSGGYTLHTFTTTGANTFRSNSASAVCVGSTTYLSCATANGVWSSSDTTIATINQSGMVTGITAGVVTITYAVTTNGCTGYTTKQFTVNPLPIVPAITGNTTLCDNTTTLLSNTSTGGVWSSSLTSKATVNSSTGLVTGVAAGNSTITYLYTDNNGCSNTNSTVVTVNASPTVAAITGNSGVCIGSTTTFGNVTLNGTWSSSNTNVATINSSGLISTVATGSSTISYTVINASACTTVVTKTVTVNALPNVTANATATTVCYGTNVTLTGGNASTYTWNNGVTNGVAFAPTATNTYTVTGTDGNGCVKTANITITVNNLPIVSISPSAATICNGYSSTLTASGASTYGWTTVSSTPYLDQVSSTSTLKLAAGLHKLKSSYSGSAIRIRRSSDNTEQNFGFNGNDLDVSAISSFIGAGTAYVTTLYDQSGNGNHLTQTSTGNQPTLTLSGLNGKPVIHTNTSQNIYTNTNFPAPFSVVYAARQTGGSRGRLLAGVNNNWLLGWWGGNRGMAYFEGWITNSCCAASDNSMYVFSGTATGSSSSFAYQNKVSITTNSSGGNTGPNGLSFNRSEASDADFTDVVEFNSVLSTTDRNVVENGMGAYYGLSGFYNTTGAVTTVNPSTTTNYTVYGTDGNGCIGTASQVVTVNPKPNAGADVTNACGGSTQTLTGTANTGTWTALGTNPTGATLSSTTSGVATVSFVNAATGTFSFIYTLPTTNCSDTMNITVGAKPDAGSDVSNICGGNIISLTGAPNTGVWSAMSSNPTTATSLSSVGASLLARYDASVTSSFTQSSGVVTTWNDLSGNGYHLTQSSTGPTLTTINGIQAFDFNSAKRMTRASVPLAQNVTVLMAVKYNSAIATWGNFMCHGDHDADWSMRHNSDGSNSVGFHTNNDNSTVLAPLTNGNTYILAGRLTQNGNGTNNVEYWAYDLNGNLATRNATFSTTISAGNKAVFVGNSDNGSEASNGKIGEILYYNSSLSSNDLTNAVNYLKDKWFNGNTGGGFTQASGVATVTYANASTGTYNYIYTSPFGCTDTTSVFVTPKPNAGADINYLCGGATQVLNGTTTNGTWSAMSTNPTGATLGSTSNGSASVTFDNLATGTYNFIYTLPTNCSDTMSITVRPKPNAGADQAVCILNVATGVNLTSNVTGVWTAKSGNAGTSNIVSANTASTQVNNFSVIGDYNYINTDNGCTDTVKVTVTPAGSIGNYVWKDQNNDGLQNEPTSNGVNGITVELYKKDGMGAFNLYASTTTANNGSGNPGYYNFGICEDGVYKIKVPTVNPFTQTHLTAQDGTAATDNNSDVNTADGFSPEVTIDTHGSGVAKDNNTIDAGYQICTKPIAGNDFSSCGGQLVAITGVSTTPALPTTDGNWSASSSNPSGATLGTTILGVATIQFDSLASGVYSFIYTVTGGCDDTLNITVGAKPGAGSDLYEVCGGSIIPVTGLPSGGTWSQASANASGATVGTTNNGTANISFANLISGTYTFIYTTPFGCTDTMTISTKPKPNAGNDVYMECGTPRLFDTIRATPFGGTWTALSSNTSQVTLGSTDTSGRARINLPIAPVQGTWTFIYTAPNGCTDTMSYTIGVTGTPAPAINSGSSPICGNSTVQICPTQFGWSNYQWYKNGVAVSGIAGTQACITIDTSKVGSYTLAGTNGSACWSKQSPAVVVSLAGAVTPTITVQGGATTACNNGSITLISSSLNNNQWNKDGVAISGAAGQYYNATASGVYTVTATNCGYTRTSTGTTITIVPYISVASIQASSGSVCTGSTLALTNSTTGGVWTSSNPAKATINSSTGLVSGVAVGSTTITYTVSLNGCSNSVNYYLNVVDGSNIATPTIVAQGATTICGSTTVQLCTGTFGWSNYQWYKNGVAVSNATGTCITVDTAKLGSYTLAAATGSGCWSVQSAAQVVGLSSLPATPSITASGSTTVCNNGTLVLTSSSSNNNQWYKGGVAISGATSQVYTASASGDYTVRVTNCAGASTSSAITVTIVPTITLSSIQSSTSSICKAATTTLSNATTGGVWTSSNTLKATVNAASGVVTGVDTGSVTITYAVSVSGCSKSVSITLTIVDGSNISAPVIAAQNSTSICANGNVTICPTTFGWSNYQWYKDGVAVALNGTSSCITADTSKLGSYTLAATNGSGCWSPQSNAVVVNTATNPATPTISGAASTCNGQTVTLTSSSSTNNQWKKDGVIISGATNQSYTTTTSGVYTVTVTNACGGSATSAGASVSIGSYITVNSIQSVTGILCKNATQTLINTTPNGVWSSNKTSVATVNPTTGLMTGVDTGTVTITYTVTVGGCSNFAAATFTVVDGSNIVTPIIVAQTSTSICSNGSVTLCPTTFGWSNYQWYKNGVLVSQNGAGACITVDTSKLGTYTLSATSGTGCWSSQSNAIVVSATAAPATPIISVSGSTTICNGSSVTLTSSASTGNQWKKDGVAISGATSQNYTASSSGVYTVTVTNCGGSATSAGTTITVAAQITVASITASGNTACMGSTITLSNATSGGVWSSSEDTIATINASGVVTPIKAGSVVISYTVTVGACSKTVTYNLTVPTGGAAATPTLDVRGVTAICGSTVLQICPATYGWSNYQWYKNGIAIAAPTGTAACINIDTSSLGSYTLAGTNGFGCWSAQSAAVPVTLASAPAAPSISTGGATSICNGSSVTLTSSSSSNNQWYKDGVAISGATSQTYAANASGVYKVATTSACGSTLSSGVTVTVSAPITVASITSNSSSTICFGNNVSLSCSTSGGVWSSSNNSVATVNASGVVTTVSAGTVVISYTVTVGACSNAATYTLIVQNGSVTTPVIAATGGATTGSTAICGSGSLQMCPQSWGYSNYQWYKNGVAYSTSACITVNTAGSYTLAGTNGSGCWSAQSAPANVTVNAIPTVNTTTGATSVCAGSSITLTNSTTIPSGGTGVWTSPYGRATVNASGVVTGTSAGTATIVYTVTSAAGCVSSVSYNVTVNAIPSVPLIAYAPGTVLTGSSSPFYGAPSGSFCTNKTFTVVGNPTGGAWSKTGVISVTNPGGVVTTGSVAGAGTLTYTYTDANGCSNSRTMSGNVVTCAPRGVIDNGQPVTASDFIIYPNPARTFISLNVNMLIGTGQIIVTDLYGKTVKIQSLSMGTNTVNVSNLSKGMYLVSVITEQGKQTKKVVVE